MYKRILGNVRTLTFATSSDKSAGCGGGGLVGYLKKYVSNLHIYLSINDCLIAVRDCLAHA